MLRELSTRIAFRIRPELKEMQGVLQTADIINTVLTLYTLPLADIGTTAFFRLNFTLEVELQPGILGTVGESQTSVVNWAGLLLHPRSDTRALGQSGPPLGMLPGLSWHNEAVHVPPSGLLALCTAGMTEAQDAGHAEYGEVRLLRTLRRHNGATSAEIAGAVSQDVAAFVDGAPQFDDITLLVVRRK